MNTRSQMACAIAGVIGVVLVLAGFLVSDYFVPPEADWTAGELASWYADNHDRVRTGLLMMLVATVGWGTLVAVITVQMMRMDAKHPILAVLQAVTGTMTYVLLVMFVILLTAAAFRPERDPDTIQLAHDAGWFMAFLAAPQFVIQAVAMGVGTLSDRRARPIYPRWFGYACLWFGALLLPGSILLYFHDGVFAYDGLISYWIPLFTFGTWMGLMGVVAYLAAMAEAQEDAAAAPEPVTA